MDVAFEDFAAHGYEGASMRQIASRAGTTIQRLLYHAPSKDALWKQVMRRVTDRAAARRQAVLDALGDVSAAAKLRHVIIDMVNFLAETPGIHRIMTFEAAQPTERLKWLCDDFLLADIQATLALIKEAQLEGAVRDLDPARLRYAILSICAVPFTIAAEFELTTGHSPFEPDEIEKTIAFICALIFVA
jgi:AcrR family transcriptional regulator